MPKTDSGASALASLLDGSTAGELIPELARHGLQQLIELEVAAVLGADRHERTEERSGYRNGSRPRLLTTQVGDIPLSIRKLRSGSFFPTILEPRRRIDQALYAVIMEAWVKGVSTRKVDALVAAIGSEAGISCSEVSRICQGLDAQIQAFLERPLDGCRYPYLYLDATYLHGRLGKTLQVCSRAVVVAMGVNADGRRELLGLKVGDSESEPFWREFLASLKQRGLTGVRLVVSDAHVGLTKAVGRMFQGCSWQRCRVHFARNLLQTVPKAQQEMVAAALRSVFTQQSAATVEEQWDQVAAMLTAKFPRAAELMAGHGPGGRAGVPALPSQPLAQALEHQPAGAGQRGDQTPHPCRRHLPQRRRDHPLGGGRAAGARRALAAGGPPHVLARLDGRHPIQRRGPAGNRSGEGCHAIADSNHSGPLAPGIRHDPTGRATSLAPRGRCWILRLHQIAVGQIP